MLICILTKNVITSCSVTMMLFLHLEVKPLMTLTTVLYLSCALISDHLAMILIELTRRRPPSTLFPYTTLFRSPFGPSDRHRNAPVLAWTSTGPSSLTYNRNVVSRSEEHTSELQSRFDLVCRLLLEKKNVISSFVGKTSYDADNRPLLVMRSNL